MFNPAGSSARRLIRCVRLAMLTLLMAATSAAAATNSAWSLHVWRSDDGLPNNRITSLAQTPDGFLWAANPSELVRFDGVRFEAFPPKAFGANVSRRTHVLLRARRRALAGHGPRRSRLPQIRDRP
jgi:ligand-binding sensor domain-containing protein